MEKLEACVGCAYKDNKKWPPENPKLTPIKVEPRAMWRIHLDTIDLSSSPSKNGNKYIVLAVDALTKYVEACRNLSDSI